MERKFTNGSSNTLPPFPDTKLINSIFTVLKISLNILKNTYSIYNDFSIGNIIWVCLCFYLKIDSIIVHRKYNIVMSYFCSMAIFMSYNVWHKSSLWNIGLELSAEVINVWFFIYGVGIRRRISSISQYLTLLVIIFRYEVLNLSQGSCNQLTSKIS